MTRASFAGISRTLTSITAGALMMALAASSVSAQQYPTGPIRIVVGFGAGSTADTLARLLGRHIETKLGQPVIVENRPGNSSMLAAEAVARGPKDGSIFFMATVANTLNPAQTNSGFDLAKEMAPVALLGVVPNVLVAHPSIPAKTVKDLIAIAKTKPDTLTFGTSGAGTASHLAAELFNAKAGTKIVAVHYQGGANQGVPDLLSGRITLMFNVAAALAPHAAAGKVVPLAVGQPKRATILPNVPTMDEAGMPGFDVGIWIGLLAPAGTPAAIVDKVSSAANEGLKTEAVMTAMRTQGIDAIGSTPKEFDTFIRGDIKKWQSILEATGLKKK